MGKKGKRSKPKPKVERTLRLSSGRRIRAERAVVAAVLLVSMILCIFVFDPKMSISGDNAEFIILAKSIVTGYGMKYINSPNPTPSTKYPFGFPLLLALIEFISPGNYIAMKVMVVLFFLSSLPVVYLLAKRHVGVLPAFAIMLFSGISPHLLDFSHQIMSEIPYLFFSLLALFLFERAQPLPRIFTSRWLISTLLILMFSYYVRSVGISLILGAVAFFLLRKDYKKALFVMVAAIALALPWYLRNTYLGGNSYLRQLVLINPYHPDLGRMGVGDLIDRIKTNLNIYLMREIPRVILPTYYNIISALKLLKTMWLVAIPLIGIILYGLISSLLERKSVVPIYLLFFFGICLLWPSVWSDLRFIVPVIPLLLLFFFQGLTLLFRRLKVPPVALFSILSVLIIILLSSNISGILTLKKRTADYPPNWKNYFVAAEWIRRNTAPDSIISCRKKLLMYLTSHRKTVGYAFSEDPDLVVGRMERDGVDYVVVEQLGFGSTPRYLIPAIRTHLDRFKVVFFVDDPPTYVLKFIRS